jgi:organic radical activating enzyme
VAALLTYRLGPESDPFCYIFSSPAWLSQYDPPGPNPLFLNLEPTNVCQLDCLFCSRQLSRRPLGYLDLDLAKTIFKEAGAWPRPALRLAGWGEPLLHPKIAEICRLAKGRGIKVKIYTNGLSLSPELMDEFIDMGLDDLQFSMQGLNADQYHFNRLRGDYRKLSDNIAMASRRRGKRPRPFLSLLTSVLSDELASGDAHGFTQEWLKLVDKVAVDLTNLNFVSETERAKPHLGRQSQGLSRRRCVDVFLAQEVKYDGSIQFCGQDALGREGHTIGRAGEMSLKDAWLGPKMEGQRELVGRSLGHASSPVCSRCYHNTDKYDLFAKASGNSRPDERNGQDIRPDKGSDKGGRKMARQPLREQEPNP